MILVDSSAFIEFYRQDGDVRASEMVAQAIRDDRVYTNGIVQVEIVPYARDSKQFRALLEDFQGYRWLAIDRSHYDEAARLGQDLRRRGITVPATDLIIASSAMGAGATLYHLDEHFDLIAKHSLLDARNLGSS